jgi:hypothetical protein
MVGPSVSVDGQRLRRSPMALQQRGLFPTSEPPRAEGVVGGIFAVLHTRQLDPREQRPSDPPGQPMRMIVLPYRDPKAAMRELHETNGTRCT